MLPFEKQMNSAIIQTTFRNSAWFMTENLKFRSERRFQISTLAEALEHRLTEKSFFFHMELCIFSIPHCIFIFPTTSLRTYFTQLCSTFLNKLTKIIVSVSTRERQGRPSKREKKERNNFCTCMFIIKNMINIHQRVRVCLRTKMEQAARSLNMLL